jgi:hypothetical protein
MVTPQKSYMEASKKHFKYIENTIEFGIFFLNITNKKFICYVDVDWEGDIDKRISISRLLIKFKGTPIS